MGLPAEMGQSLPEFQNGGDTSVWLWRALGSSRVMGLSHREAMELPQAVLIVQLLRIAPVQAKTAGIATLIVQAAIAALTPQQVVIHLLPMTLQVPAVAPLTAGVALVPVVAPLITAVPPTLRVARLVIAARILVQHSHLSPLVNGRISGRVLGGQSVHN